MIIGVLENARLWNVSLLQTEQHLRFPSSHCKGFGCARSLGLTEGTEMMLSVHPGIDQ